MVAAEFIITFLIAPRDAQRGYDSPGVRFVFMCEQEIDTALEQLRIARSCRKRKAFGCPFPLPDESLARLLKGNTQRLRQRAKRVVLSRAECQTDRDFATPGEIEAAGQRDIAVEDRVVLPVEAIIISQVRPAVIHPDVTAGTIRKRNCSADHQPRVAFGRN